MSDSYVSDSQATASPVTRASFQFTGEGFEYFKIWIVNILLSIITLGIYSAWAKVRNKQYFYGNTTLADSTFSYTADPVKILIGRVVAIGAYALLFFLQTAAPLVGMVVGILILVGLPWIIVRSLKFNARHSEYRNVAFRFNGTTWDAFKYFILWPILGAITLFILMPFAWKRQYQYITNNHSYGAEPFKFDIEVKEYYKLLLILIGSSVLFVIVLGALLGGSLAAIMSGNIAAIMAAMGTLIAVFVLYIVFAIGINAYVMVSMNNLHFNNTSLQNHRFEANWEVVSYGLLLVTNTLGVMFTFGLFLPWAKIRTARYKAAHLALVVEGSLDGFVATTAENTSAIGEGVHDIFDIDISL